MVINKKAVSPLIATVLLVMIVVSIGAAVMLVLKRLNESNIEKINRQIVDIKCGSSVTVAPIKIDEYYQVCFSNSTVNSDNNITAILQNKGNLDIVNFKVTVIGRSGVFENITDDTLAQGATKRFVFHYNSTESGIVEEIRITPVITDAPGRDTVSCIDRAIVREASETQICPLFS